MSDAYFVVAHLHYVAFETAVFTMLAGFYVTLLVQQWLGVKGI